MSASLDSLRAFAASTLGAPPGRVQALAGGGSDRRYYRLWVGEASAIGAISENPAELRAFLAFTRHFAAKGIPVPAIRAADERRGLCLLEDLGPLTLRDHLAALRKRPDGDARRLAALEAAVRWLPVIQVRGGEGLDYSACIADAEMGPTTYEADIRLFLDQFVRRYAPTASGRGGAPAALEALAARAAALERSHFCYRDFQTRNIMWRQERPVFIDYQSGRRGPLAYDLASILYSPDSGLEEPDRARLIGAYLEALGGCGVRPGEEAFLDSLYPLVLLRRMQALGAYARLAAEKGKRSYLRLIPASLDTLRAFVEVSPIGAEIPALRDWLLRVCDSARSAMA
jgi:aminoglycoside/choline kinase family phosphotransferase